MTRYNRKKIDRAAYETVLRLWIGKGLLKPEEINSGAMGAEKPYRDYHLLKRIGLYLGTLIAVHSVIGFFYLAVFDALDGGENIYKFLMLITGVSLYILLDRMIPGSSLYKQGTDDALLHAAFFYTSFGLGALVDLHLHTLPNMLLGAFILLPVAAVSAIRYADSLMAVFTIILIYTIPLLGVALINMQLLFFSALVVIPLGIFLLTRIGKADTFKHHYWKNCFSSSRFAICVLMYASINLYVIKSLAFSLMGVDDIPLHFVFLALTILAPFIFIVTGLVKKKKYLVHAGLFLLIPTVSTIRYYYSVMPAELALMMAGLAITLVSYFAITHLRKTGTAYTFEADHDEEELNDMETLGIVQGFGHKEN
ncbi:MAG: hypothetical protein V4658_13465, partial [Bacteroidota bacterium]